ncbi:M20 family metallopeptidase [Desulfoluna spongiiphila]|nr:M20/M25/M40 family metallo-hydrolase [Desulfoluna spongiiphila]
MMLPPFHQDTCVDLLISLAETPGPSLGESPRRQVLDHFLKTHGVETTVDAAGNLRVLIGDGPWEETVVFDAHMDVVQEGFEAKVTRDGDRLIGMGVADDLAAVTLLAHLAVALSGREATLKRPLLILFSTGEEGDGNLKGIRHLVAEMKKPPHLFVSFDLNFDHICLTALGSKRYRITAKAPGGHSWSDFGLPGAIDALMALLTEVKHRFTATTAPHPGQASCNIGTIQGGEGINSISAGAAATFEFRSVAPDILDRLDQDLRECLASHATEAVTFTCATTGERPAASPVESHRIEPMAVKAIQDATGITPKEIPMSTNINLPLSKGWPCVCMGLCQGDRFHSHEEFLITDSLAQGWEVLQAMLPDDMA